MEKSVHRNPSATVLDRGKQCPVSRNNQYPLDRGNQSPLDQASWTGLVVVQYIPGHSEDTVAMMASPLQPRNRLDLLLDPFDDHSFQCYHVCDVCDGS